MAEINTKLIGILRVLGVIFLVGAGLVVIADLAFNLDWNQTSSLFFLSFLLICGLCFGITGIMSENPERTRKLFFEWLVVITVILVWVVGVYAFLP
ncbi:MAG: hypothetical protein ACFFD8_04080 [Candidatus Thorarchaeota archaeon]